jgi:hypothetical protein
MTTTSEPEVIALLRNRPEGFNALYNADESYLCQGDDILAAYDAIVAQRGAAVRELHNTRLNSEIVAEVNRRFDAECTTLRARLAACERDLNYIRRVTVGAVESDKLAATCKTIGEYRVVLLKAMHAYGIAAVAAETQATPHTGGTDA